MIRERHYYVQITFRFYLTLVAIALAISAVIQLSPVTQEMLSSAGIWAYAPGWQREIAFWNVMGLFLIIAFLRRNQEEELKLVVAGVMILTFCLSINHLFYAVGEPAWHLFLAFLNFIGFLMGVGALARYNLLKRLKKITLS